MQFEPIVGPAAWQGQQLFETHPWPMRLSAAELDELAAATSSTAALPVATLSRHNFELPQLAPKLASLQTELEEGCGAILIKGCDIERFSGDDLQRMFYGLTTHLGTAVSQSSEGDIVFSVRDEGHKADDAPGHAGASSSPALAPAVRTGDTSSSSPSTAPYAGSSSSSSRLAASLSSKSLDDSTVALPLLCSSSGRRA